jgi:hypothetical protein
MQGSQAILDSINSAQVFLQVRQGDGINKVLIKDKTTEGKEENE